MLKHKRHFFGGWIAGIGAGLAIADGLVRGFHVDLSAIDGGIIAVITVAGLMIATGGRLTSRPGERH